MKGKKNKMQYVQHPGVILKRDFMDRFGVSINRLAREIHVPPNRISAIVNKDRSITADTAMRLSRYFKTSPKYWMHLQVNYDLANIACDDQEIRPLVSA